ncbi:DNA polymerase nu-like [Dendrobates tinctorius]|uniref:DNA polymerase nu-like n=1 Tax=Dendrobates tinctorius TaxID=92724 RepID=UPI003CC94F67
MSSANEMFDILSIPIPTSDGSFLSMHSLYISCKKLSVLHHLMMSLKHRLQAEGLWDLFYNIELPLITILAAMENCSIEINQEELKRTSVLLGIHLKELEKEAQHAAGQKFRLTSNNELRTILFEKFHLHLKCKNKLPQTNLGHLLSTAEPATLLKKMKGILSPCSHDVLMSFCHSFTY